MALEVLEPEVREWFRRRFVKPTLPQEKAFPLIASGKNVLITAPTGSGKTLAGFLVIISELIKLYKKEKLEDRVYCIYISPLRALNNDIKRNLEEPLRELGYEDKIRVAIRTGDTLPSEKSRQLHKPPHILITTPESLAIILNAPRFREKLKPRWVIVDEIHELADNKRGVHLTLSLERLAWNCEFQRIGLGATLHPLEEIAKFLGGFRNGKPRKVEIVNAIWSKPLDVLVISPVEDLIHTSAEMINEKMYELLDELIRTHSGTIVFTNTRSGTERVAYHLKERWGDYEITLGAHHGSMSREERLEVEEKLKRGELKVVVTSTSLELGIDIGHVDLVVQIGSPKSVSRAVQRIGRSGHSPFSVAKGRIIVLDRDDAVECGVMLKCAVERFLDKVRIPRNCLDVLAQHIVGMALERKWEINEAYELVRRAYPYRTLEYDDFLSVLYYLAGRYVPLEDRRVYAKIWLDEGKFGRRGKLTRVIYYLNLGTIPDEVKVDVYRKDGRWVGSIEEDFLERLRKGDIFVLGGKRYRFLYARAMRAYVEPAEHEIPTIPAWFSEMLPLSWELAEKIREFRERAGRVKNLEEFVFRELPVSREVARSIAGYFEEQRRFFRIPDKNEIVVELTRDLNGEKVAVFHALFGRKVNDALSRVFAMIAGKMGREDIHASISDNGFSLRYSGEIDWEKVMEEFKKCDMEELLKKNLRRTELMKRRFRHVAARSFLVLRNYKGHKISVRKQQLNAQTLLRICEKLENFPAVKETYREILYDVFDLEHALEVQQGIRSGKFKVVIAETPVPSPFAHNLIVLGEADIIRMTDRKERLLRLYEEVVRRIGAV